MDMIDATIGAGVGFVLGILAHIAKTRISESHRGRTDCATIDHQRRLENRSEVVKGLMGLLTPHLRAVTALVAELNYSHSSIAKDRHTVQATNKELSDFHFTNLHLLPEPLAEQVTAYIRFLNREVNRFEYMMRDPNNDQSEWTEIDKTVRKRGSADLAAIEKEFRKLLGTE